MKEFFILDNGIKLHAKLEFPYGKEAMDEGEKCPLLLIIHGFTGHMEEKHIVAVSDLGKSLGYAALRVEMYGHGKSDGEFSDHDLYKWISNGLKAIDYAKSLDFVSEIYLTGHSQGGLLTMLLAGIRPYDLKKVIPLSPALCIPDGARKGDFLGYTFDPEKIPERIEVWDDRWIRGDYVSIAQSIHAEDFIRKYHGPVLLIHGDADETVEVEYSYWAHERYENSELVIISGDDHCFDYHLEEMIEALRNWISYN